MRLIFRAEAAADLRVIARETRKGWGEAQAKIYVASLRRGIKALVAFPLRYPEFTPRPGVRRMNSGRHAVFYLAEGDRVEIIRILHGARDLDQLL